MWLHFNLVTELLMSRGKVWNSQFRKNTIVIVYICCITSLFALSLDTFIKVVYLSTKIHFLLPLLIIRRDQASKFTFRTYLLLSCYYTTQNRISLWRELWWVGDHLCGRKRKGHPTTHSYWVPWAICTTNLRLLSDLAASAFFQSKSE